MSDIELARASFQAEGLSFALVKDGRELARGTQDGIGELLRAVERLGAELQGASLADKIVGKAVALVSAHAGIRAVYTPLASEAAEKVLADHRIELTADRMVPLILNRRGDGPCPMERLSLPLATPREGMLALQEFVASRAPR